MNFQEIIYQMDILTVVDIDLLSFNAFRADKIHRSAPEVDYSSYLRAYQCNQDFEEISALPVLEGSSLTICVQSVSTSYSFEKFQDLELTQNGYGSYESLEIISSGKRVSDDIVVGCDESNTVCYSSVILDSRFFKEAAPAPISTTGSVVMSKNRRLIASNASDEVILGKLGEKPKVGEFQVLVEITSIDSMQTTSNSAAPPLDAQLIVQLALFAFGWTFFVN